LVRPHRWCNG